MKKQNLENKVGSSRLKGQLQPIAIVGMSCRFPGSADSPSGFWKLLEDKVDAVNDIPADRWDTELYYDPEKNVKGKMYTKQGGFLKDVDLFDNVFFKISPLETESLDPQVRLVLELSYELLENAGYEADKLKGTATGVFVGMTIVDYIEKDIRAANPNSINAYSVTGTQMSSASGRVSYAFGFEGPSITLDTACSSSLASVHLACQSLLSGDSDMAMAGGVNLILSPKYHVAFCELNALATDSRSKAFDASADGFVRSEGGGLIMLKRYEDAVKDNDNILALIPGSAITNDGISKGYTVPRMEAQAKAIRAALDAAGLTPDDIDYFESHGTGTPVGDPIEMEGIASVFQQRKSKRKLLVGSVKTNIGHCESAAGIAGLIKSVLALNHNKIPANLHFNNPNPAINWDDIPVQIPTDEVEWLPGDKTRYAAVSAFGLSGTNVNIVLQETPEIKEVQQSHIADKQQYILPISAANTAALKALATLYIDKLNAATGVDDWKNLCVAAALHRTHWNCRFAASGKTKEALLGSLSELVENDFTVAGNGTDKKTIFVFPGQGSQWIGMGRELMKTEKVFLNSMIECDRAIRLYCNWSLLEEIDKDEAKNRFEEVDVIQPVLFAIEVSLAKLWESRGVKPDVVIGHSMGEVAAAYIAGILSIEDAAAVICKRSALAKTVSGEGAMALVELSREDAEEAISAYPDTVAIAACNGPQSTVISGNASDVNTILAALNEKAIFNRLIKVDYASHSPQMDQLKTQLLEQLGAIKPVKGNVPVFSTVLDKLTDGAEFDAKYWSDNLRSTVLFAQAVAQLMASSECIFIEVSPHPILVQLIEQAIEFYNNTTSAVVHSTKRNMPEEDELLNCFKNLYQKGATVNWSVYYGTSRAPFGNLPAYPWQKDRFWIDTPDTPGFALHGSGSVHPLLGREIRFANDKNTVCWESVIDSDNLKYLEDHQVRGTVIFPGAGYVEMVYAAIIQSFGKGNHKVCDIKYRQPLNLSGKPKMVQLLMSMERKNSLRFELFSADADENGQNSWEYHCEGYALLFNDEQAISSVHKLLNSGFDDYPVHVMKETHYQMMQAAGIMYGPRFQGVEEIWANTSIAVGKVNPDERLKKSSSKYHFHPAILDACFQVCMASLTVSEDGAQETYLPAEIGTFYLSPGSLFDRSLWVLVENEGSNAPGQEAYTRNIKICDETGVVLAVAEGFVFKKLKEQNKREVKDTFYKIRWEKAKPVDKESNIERKRTWLVFENQPLISDELAVSANAYEHQLISVADADTFLIRYEGEDMLVELNMKEREDFVKLFTVLEEKHISITDVVFARGLSIDMSSRQDAENNSMSLIYLIQAMDTFKWSVYPKLFIVTSAAQQVIKNEMPNPFAALLLGISRVAFHEHTEFGCTRIDLSSRPQDDKKLLNSLFYAATEEKEYAVRDNDLYVPRLNHYDIPETTELQRTALRTLPASAADSFQFVTDEPGTFDNITIREVHRVEPGDDQIEVEVAATGLNFMNVMSALGIYPGYPRGFLCLGIEFTGVVRRTGKSVKDMKPGDRVIGLSPEYDCMGKYAICKSLQAVKIPDQIQYLDAATIAVAYGTAYACLVVYGNLKKGERVLIHSATGGVGLAAIQIAMNAGAEIYATAGSEEKREMLRKMGVKYVMNSHTLDFAKEIRTYTNGEGIDVVLNSLTGEAMYQSMKLLRGFGRFLEIGKKDIYENSNLKMDIFKESISYTFFDLHKMLNERPELVRGYLEGVMHHFSNGDYKPIPKTVFAASDFLEGFNKMARGQHVGKIVFDMNDPALMIEPVKRIFSADGTYMVTGGMGGLGFALVKWMCTKGASNIVLTGRNMPDAEMKNEIDALTANKKININILTGDISNRQDVDSILQKIRTTMPPLKGVFHAAGMLSDSSIAKLDEVTFKKPLASKVQGTINLHEATRPDELTYFVLFSSVASSLGSMGQANYVAANAFMDSLSKLRQSMNLPVNCINWGPVAEIGLAAQDDNRGNRLEKEGIASFTTDDYLESMELVLTRNLSDVNIFDFNYTKWVENNPSYAIDKMLSNLAVSELPVTENSFVNELKNAASGPQALMMMQEQLREILGGILKASPSKIDVDLPFANMGLDSLMAIQLRNKLQKLLGIQVPITTFWNYPRVSLLSRHLIEMLGLNSEAPAAAETDAVEEIGIDELVQQMSDTDMISELDKELKDI